MDDRPGGEPERRKFARIALKGTVIVTAGEHAMRGRISNLSQGGMLVSTAVSAPERMLARAVALEIRLDGADAEWIPVTGKITRLSADAIAVAFDEAPTGLLRVIDEMSTASRARLRVMSLVLVDADVARRAKMAAGFRSAGCGVVEASTPLEAIVRLGESHFEFDLIAIADSVPGTVADELRVFVERDHPRLKLVTIGSDAIEPDGIVNWLSAADPGSDLAMRVREMLGRPRP